MLVREPRLAALLLTSTMLACFMSGASASAQSAAPAASASQVVNFSIPAQPLSAAINAFIRATGWQVSYSSQLAMGKSSSAVIGGMTPSQGLQQLVARTGLQVRIGAAGSTALVDPSNPAVNTVNDGSLMLDTIDVQAGVDATAVLGNLPPAYAGGQVATGGQLGMLGNRSVMDTPFNQTSYTSELVKNQQARTLSDVLANDPSVKLSSARNSGIETFDIRGFASGVNDVTYGGMYGVLPFNSLSTQFAERVEVLKGPSAFLNGMAPLGSVGGTINIVPKRATDTPITDLTATYLSNGEVGGIVDFGRRFGPENEFGVRFNGVYRNGDTAVENSSEELSLAVLGLDYKGERLRVSVDLGYQEQDFNGTQRPLLVLPGFQIPTAPDPASNWMQPWFNINSRDTFGAARAEYDLFDDFTLYGGVGGRLNDRSNVFATPIIQNAFGAISQSVVGQGAFYDALSATAGLRWKFETGLIGHDVNFNWTGLEQDNGSLNGTRRVSILSNIYNPIFVPNPNLVAPGNVPQTGSIDLSSVALSDTISAFQDRIQFTVGARHQNVAAANYSATTGATTSSYDASALSPFYGLVLKPLQNVSFYANYIQGLQQGSIAPDGTVNAGEVFPPYQTDQYEAGVKIDWGALTTTMSVFQITNPNAYTDPSTNIYAVDGEQRNRGLEFNVFGEVSDSIRLLGGATFLDGVLVRTAGGTYDGNTAPGVPQFTFVLGGEWDTPFVPNLTLTARANYVSLQYYDNANMQSIPSWTRYDVGARYTFEGVNGKRITIRANIENLLDTRYWQSAGGSSLVIGIPRTYLLSAAFSF